MAGMHHNQSVIQMNGCQGGRVDTTSWQELPEDAYPACAKCFFEVHWHKAHIRTVTRFSCWKACLFTSSPPDLHIGTAGKGSTSLHMTLIMLSLALKCEAAHATPGSLSMVASTPMQKMCNLSSDLRYEATRTYHFSLFCTF
eukprot:4584606-Amphidinium_carterae.1